MSLNKSRTLPTGSGKVLSVQVTPGAADGDDDPADEQIETIELATEVEKLAEGSNKEGHIAKSRSLKISGRSMRRFQLKEGSILKRDRSRRGRGKADEFMDTEDVPSHMLPEKLRKSKKLDTRKAKKDQAVNWKEVYLRLDLPDPNWWIIHPDKWWRMAWDLIMLVCVLYVAIMVPPQLAFPVLETPEIDIALYVIFGLDICITFITGYREFGNVILNQRRVAHHYAVTWLVIDVLATFPFEFMFESGEATSSQAAKAAKGSRGVRSVRVVRISRLTRLLRLTRILKIVKFTDMIQHAGHLMTIHPAIFRLIKAFVLQLYMSHLMACIWCWVPHLESYDGARENWPTSRGLSLHMYDDPSDWATVYMHAVYWAFTTMTTVGYGDVSAYTTGEMIFACTAQILGVTFYGFIIGSINAVVESLDKRNAAFARKHEKYQDFIYGSNLPEVLKGRVVAHFRSWQSEKKVQTFLEDSEDVMEDLPADLRHEVLFHMHRALISRIPFLKGKPMGFIAGVVKHINFEMVQPEGVVIEEGGGQGKHGDVFFVLRGVCSVYKKGTLVGDLMEGAIFGEMAVMYNKVASATVLSKTKCELATCPGRVFLKMLDHHPVVREEVRQLAAARRDSKFHAGLPSWWFKVYLLGGTGKDLAVARFKKRGTKKITQQMINKDVAAFTIQKAWISYAIRVRKSRSRIRKARSSPAASPISSPPSFEVGSSGGLDGISSPRRRRSRFSNNGDDSSGDDSDGGGGRSSRGGGGKLAKQMARRIDDLQGTVEELAGQVSKIAAIAGRTESTVIRLLFDRDKDRRAAAAAAGGGGGSGRGGTGAGAGGGGDIGRQNTQTFHHSHHHRDFPLAEEGKGEPRRGPSKTMISERSLQFAE